MGEFNGNDLDQQLFLVRGILERAFFSPLHLYDWPAFCFDQGVLLGMEWEEVYDLFIRGSIASEAVHPEAAEGRAPLAWLWGMENPNLVLAQALGSMRVDRPWFFHRVLLSLPEVTEGRMNPSEYDVLEDFLAKALEGAGGLRENVAGELWSVRARALRAAGVDPEGDLSRVREEAARVMEADELPRLLGEHELLIWLTSGGGLEGVPPDLAPAVMVEVWSRWAGMVTGVVPDLDLLVRLLPELDITSSELALFAPPDRAARPVIEAVCPYCSMRNRLQLGQAVKGLNQCPHLVYMGTSDQAHLYEVVKHFDLGADIVALLDSYYDSPADLELFSTLVSDLSEMFTGQGRLTPAPLECASGAEPFYYLKAYFAGPGGEGNETVH